MATAAKRQPKIGIFLRSLTRLPAAPWRMGVEVELLAPPGRSRRDLAEALARHLKGGVVERFFHPQSEPSEVPGRPVFHNLTLGYRVLSLDGQWVASFVDDLTLQYDLLRSAPAQDGWSRVISDDPRLLSLIVEQCRATADLPEVLRPLARLFGSELREGPDGMRKVEDRRGTSVAIAAPLPGERERPCEIVTAPMGDEGRETLEKCLELARGLGFVLPREGACHLHFDGTPLQSTPVFCKLVSLLAQRGERFKTAWGTNPHCRRLGPWPPAFQELVEKEEFAALPWAQACAEALASGLSKYCDFNLRNLLGAHPDWCTLEVRILPSCLESTPILRAAREFESLLHEAIEG